MDEYLTKPVSSKQLHEMLSRWLAESTEVLATDNPEVQKAQLTIVPNTPVQEVESKPLDSSASEPLDTAPLDSAAFADVEKA